MNRIQRIQKLFHTDKWWGKVLFIFFFNLVFFLLGILVYNLFLSIGRSSFNLSSNGFFEIFYLCVLLPVLSSICIIKIWKKFDIKINKIALFFLNLLIIILMFLSFFLIAFYSIKPNFF